MKGKKTIIAIFLGLNCLFFVISCAQPQPAMSRPRESTVRSAQELVLRQRVKAFLALKAQGLWGNLAEFYDPAYRNLAPKGNYARRVRVLDPRIVGVDFLQPDKASVRVRFSIEISGIRYLGEEETQLWARRGETWYYLPVDKAP